MLPTADSENDSGEQWLHARAIFDEVQSAPADQRSTILEKLCDGDAALKVELQSLLEAYDAEQALSESISEEISAPGEPLASPRRIGAYAVDRLLGRGGMGAVYLAHRADGQFDQQVAVKVIDVPLATDFFRRQFRTERQILAGLGHPFIARLLDGGVTADGELFLVMEYVKGIPIVQYCQQKQLSLRARLSLFKDVCCAVQYAHQNLVIHRDLKPDNILVVEDGTPRLLDFGTAKLLNPLQQDNTGELTQQGLRSFTPQYASPEQVLGKAISTSSDIYSLGVILFQVLTDVPPYVLREFNTEEMLRVICTEQPPRPSAVAVCSEKPDPDLDSITLMAMRKEPAERYLTVDQFSGDVQAWLDGQPVMARRGTLRYRTGKFAKRHKLALSAAALLFTAVALGVAGVLWQSRVANLQRVRAEANAQEMRDLSNSFLFEIDQAVSELPGAMPVRRLMVQRVLQHLDNMAKNAPSDRLTQLYLADAYIHLGSLQGNPYGPNIGDSRGALDSLSKALALAQSLKSTYPRDREVIDVSARGFMIRSAVLWGIGRTQEAVDSVRVAIKTFEEEIEGHSASASKLSEAALAYHLLGDELGEPGTPCIGDYSAALVAYQRSRDLYNRTLEKDPGFIGARRELALNPLKFANIIILTDPGKAIDKIHESLALWNAIPIEYKSGLNEKRTILYNRILLGDALSRTRRYALAISTYEQLQRSLKSSAAWDSNDSRALVDVAGILGDEADTYVDMLDPLLNPRAKKDRHLNTLHAIKLLEGAMAANEKLLSSDPGNQDWATYLGYEKAMLGTLRQRLGDRNNGTTLAASGIAVLRRIASSSGASEDALFHATSAMLMVLPIQLREPRLTVQYAERLAVLTKRQDPTSLLLLSGAYRADGQSENANSTALEGLNLLPPDLPGTPAPRCRVLLEHSISRNVPKH